MWLYCTRLSDSNLRILLLDVHCDKVANLYKNGKLKISKEDNGQPAQPSSLWTELQQSTCTTEFAGTHTVLIPLQKIILAHNDNKDEYDCQS